MYMYVRMNFTVYSTKCIYMYAHDSMLLYMEQLVISPLLMVERRPSFFFHSSVSCFSSCSSNSERGKSSEGVASGGTSPSLFLPSLFEVSRLSCLNMDLLEFNTLSACSIMCTNDQYLSHIFSTIHRAIVYIYTYACRTYRMMYK